MWNNFHWSDHACQRWNERFPGINRHLEFSSSTNAGRKTKKLIKQLTPTSSKEYMKNFNGRYYLIGRSNIVFVVSCKCIVTVFHLYGSEV